MDIRISLAAARVNAGLTQKEMAEKLGVSKATIGCWERGATAPKYDQFEEFCNVCNIPASCVFLRRASV